MTSLDSQKIGKDETISLGEISNFYSPTPEKIFKIQKSPPKKFLEIISFVVGRNLFVLIGTNSHKFIFKMVGNSSIVGVIHRNNSRHSVIVNLN